MNEPDAPEAGTNTASTGARRHALRAARIGVSIVALVLLFRRVDLGELPHALVDAGFGTLTLALAAYLASQVVSALRWRLIARSAGFELSASAGVRYYFIGMFFTTLGPSTLGSDVVRTLYLKTHGRSRLDAATAVLFDRVIGFVSLAVIAAGAIASVGWPALPAPLRPATALFAASLLLAGLAMLALARRRRPGYAAGPPFLTSLLSLCRDGAMVARASVLSIVVQMLQIGVAIVLAAAVTPSVHWTACFVFQPLVAMLGALPISVAGLGVRESGYVYFLTTLGGVPMESAAAFALAWLAILVLASLIGGIVFLAGGEGPSWRALRRNAQSAGAQFPSSS